MSFLKKHPVLILVILLVLIVVLIIATAGDGEISPLENAVGNVTSAPSSGFNRFTYNVGNWFRTVFGISDLQKENAELQERNMQLESRLASMDELEQENERLRALANYVEENKQYDIVTARVSGKSPGYWFSSFTINRGRNHGVVSGQVVLDSTGNLVGRVGETGGNWSKVESIIDPSSRVSAIVERTRDIVMVRGVASVAGSDDDRLCEIYFIPLDNDLLPGDVIVTSGLDTGDGVVYPKGLPIGSVLSVDLSSNSVERTAVLQPQTSFSSLEEVLVIVDSAAMEAEAPVAENASEYADEQAAEGALEESPEEAMEESPEETIKDTLEESAEEDASEQAAEAAATADVIITTDQGEEIPQGVLDAWREGQE